ASVPFGVSFYGFANPQDAYGYPGGIYFGTNLQQVSVSLSPGAGTNELASTYCVASGVTDLNGQPMRGVRVDFVVSGSNVLSGAAYTDMAGQARWGYAGTNLGADTITATAGAASASATNVWVLPSFTLHGAITDSDSSAGALHVGWASVSG